MTKKQRTSFEEMLARFVSAFQSDLVISLKVELVNGSRIRVTPLSATKTNQNDDGLMSEIDQDDSDNYAGPDPAEDLQEEGQQLRPKDKERSSQGFYNIMDGNPIR